MSINCGWPVINAPDLQKSTLCLLLFVVVLGLGLLAWQGTEMHDGREPPILRSKIPLIGHLIGTLRHQVEYPQILSSRVSWPIFTINILSGRIYIVTSGELMQAVYRNAKTLSFDPFVIHASKRIFGLTERQLNILRTERPGIESEFPLSKETSMIAHKTLQDRLSLQDMTTRGLNRFADFLHLIGTEKQSVNLYEWLRHTMTIASSTALYGPANPITEDPSRIKTLDDFETSMPLLFLNIFPSSLAPAGHRARAAFTRFFKSYYKNRHYLNASAIIRARYDLLNPHGMTGDDCAQFDVGILDAAVMNSNPAIFYMLCYIYSSPSLVSSLRNEVQAIVNRTADGEARVDISSLNEKCPLLVSAWQETLRLVDSTVSSRVVLEDTLLAGQYLLKKGGVLQLACGPSHIDPSIWGEDANKFNIKRFVASTVEKLDRDQRKKRKLAYNPFGGGTVLCPGRYFATQEILGIATTLILAYHITTPSGEPFSVPPFKKKGFTEQVSHPAHDIPVSISRREGWEGVRWVYYYSGAGEGREGLEF